MTTEVEYGNTRSKDLYECVENSLRILATLCIRTNMHAYLPTYMYYVCTSAVSILLSKYKYFVPRDISDRWKFVTFDAS